ncbi:dTMP kinase [Rubeoparvulum massiliense]|uniref:dTMP kinase n=1 Tax=Rubeoparvulum massiliense TaxID=1631346 RepID=UPI00065DE6F8|nr:dTMP kinase [Rubeoparvulum massiliense]
MKGMFITLEGPDGSGKTTQVKAVTAYLKEHGIEVVRTREPGGTTISDQIRTIILSPANQEMVHETEILLYAASRAQHVREKIIPALERGAWVVCDRFTDASIAYQGYGMNYPLDPVIQINRFATGGLEPDLTFFLDVPVEIGFQRIRQRALETEGTLDRIERREEEYHQRVYAGFKEWLRTKDRVVTIDATQNQEEVTRVIEYHLDTMIKSH